MNIFVHWSVGLTTSDQEKLRLKMRGFFIFDKVFNFPLEICGFGDKDIHVFITQHKHPFIPQSPQHMPLESANFHHTMWARFINVILKLMKIPLRLSSLPGGFGRQAEDGNWTFISLTYCLFLDFYVTMGIPITEFILVMFFIDWVRRVKK